MNELPLPQPLDREEWRQLPRDRDYEVSSLGRVRSYRSDRTRQTPPHVLSPKRKSFHPQVVICDDTRKRTEGVHRLVLLAFVGPPPEGKPVCRHLNGNSHDNSINNLCWGSSLENSQDQRRHGTVLRGEAAGSSKLTEGEVWEIVRRVRSGESQSAVGRTSRVGLAGVNRIMLGQTWGWLTGIKRSKAADD